MAILHKIFMALPPAQVIHELRADRMPNYK